MSKNKHLTLTERSTIETLLNQRKTFAQIALVLEKDPSTISKEIRNHLSFQRIGAYYQNYNACAKRVSCTKSHICKPCHASRNYKLCKRCSMCNAFCSDFEQQICKKLSKPPYCCNGCKYKSSCTLEKRTYLAIDAHLAYQKVLSEARLGISFSEAEIKTIDEIVSPLIKQGQSPHHICVTNPDTIMISERTIYRLIDKRILLARNIDLPRKVRFSARKNPVHAKVDKACRIGRNFQCFSDFISQNPDISVTQLDSVEGQKGGKVLLTIHFVQAEMMLAFIRERNDSKSVIDIFNYLYDVLEPAVFSSIFQVCLADNGSEFSNPAALELNADGAIRTRIFYCDPSAPYQKGSAERNHEFIRCFFPKGAAFDDYSQEDISLMMDHINSYSRKSLGNKTPYEMFSFMYGKEVLDLLGCHLIPPQDVTLKKSIFSREV